MSDEELNIIDDGDEVESCASERAALRDVVLSTLKLFVSIIKRRLEQIKSHTKLNEIFETTLPGIKQEFRKEFVVKGRKDYPYDNDFGQLLKTPTGFETPDQDFDARDAFITERAKCFFDEMKSVAFAIRKDADCLVAAKNWLNHQIYLCLVDTQRRAIPQL